MNEAVKIFNSGFQKKETAYSKPQLEIRRFPANFYVNIFIISRNCMICNREF